MNIQQSKEVAKMAIEEAYDLIRRTGHDSGLAKDQKDGDEIAYEKAAWKSALFSNTDIVAKDFIDDHFVVAIEKIKKKRAGSSGRDNMNDRRKVNRAMPFRNTKGEWR